VAAMVVDVLPCVLMVAGIPGTGKSTFCRFLADRHGFAFYEVDRMPQWQDRAAWEDLLQRSRSEFVARFRELHPKGAVLEWGFVPEQAPLARELIGAGMRPIWFAGDYNRARELFVARGTVLPDLFDLQVGRIKAADLPQSLPEFQVVCAFREDRAVRPPEELYAEIFGAGS